MVVLLKEFPTHESRTPFVLLNRFYPAKKLSSVVLTWEIRRCLNSLVWRDEDPEEFLPKLIVHGYTQEDPKGCEVFERTQLYISGPKNIVYVCSNIQLGHQI
eukprot:NODE_261_length_12589_cov_0.423139.p11 type:complete len:102 gc:universal NODE_261_length_12589_cov_0.423139:9111-8806(-)